MTGESTRQLLQVLVNDVLAAVEVQWEGHQAGGESTRQLLQALGNDALAVEIQ